MVWETRRAQVSQAPTFLTIRRTLLAQLFQTGLPYPPILEVSHLQYYKLQLGCTRTITALYAFSPGAGEVSFVNHSGIGPWTIEVSSWSFIACSSESNCQGLDIRVDLQMLNFSPPATAGVQFTLSAAKNPNAGALHLGNTSEEVYQPDHLANRTERPSDRSNVFYELHHGNGSIEAGKHISDWWSEF